MIFASEDEEAYLGPFDSEEGEDPPLSPRQLRDLRRLDDAERAVNSAKQTAPVNKHAEPLPGERIDFSKVPR